MFELAARARFEAGDSFAQAVVDGGVVAEIEVQVAQFLEAAPVAAVEDVAFAHGEGAGNDLPVTARDEEGEAVLPALAQEIEESVEVLASPVQFVDGRFVEPKHRAEQIVGNLVAGVDADLDALADASSRCSRLICTRRLLRNASR